MRKIIAILFVMFFVLAGCGDGPNREYSTGDGTVVSNDVESEQSISEDPLADFYEEFLKTGTVGNIKDMAKEYGLYADSRRTGTGRELFKVAETYEEARVISNDDVYKGDYYVRIE